MRFTIDAECKRGLRIIGELPDFQISRIEGYNGIGKSSALRLLELCTGSQPFLGQERLWASFREQLVHATVRVTGLQGDAREILWDLDPSAWPAGPELLGKRLGNVQIDGRSAKCEDVEPLLRVYTIPGNETFTATLASRLEATSRTLDAWIRHGDGTAWQRMEVLDSLLAESSRIIQAPSASELRGMRLDLTNAESSTREAALALQRVQERVARLSEAKELTEQLDDIRGRGPEFSEQVADLERQQETLVQERSSLDERITETGRREHKDEAARREFTLARAHLERRERELKDARGRLNAAAADAGGDSDPSTINALQETLSLKLEELTQRLPAVNASPLVARLLSEIAHRLRQAEASGLADQVLISESNTRPHWTVAEWRNACEREAASRAAESVTDTAQEMEAEIAQVRKRLQVLAHVAELRAEAGQATANKTRASERLTVAINNLPPEEATTLDQLVSARQQVEAQLTELAERHAAVQHALNLLGGGIDERTLRERLVQICDDIGVPESRVRGQLATEQERLADAREAFATSQLDTDNLRRRAEESVRNVETALTVLRQRPDLSFARNAAGDFVFATGLSEADQATALGTLRTAMEGAAQGTRAAVNQVQGIVEALAAVAKQFRGTGRPSEGAHWVRPVQEWLASQVSEWFAQSEVRQALFPDGHDISVDIEGMAVSWTADGERRTRPMSAFSSGQQALAYTRARMASLDSEGTRTANRLIALDEFGAFIDTDGMRRLSNYLLDRHATFPRDQIIVVLPLRQEIQNVPDPEDAKATERWRQLQERGYLAEQIMR
jgi:hypothetical protein